VLVAEDCPTEKNVNIKFVFALLKGVAYLALSLHKEEYGDEIKCFFSFYGLSAYSILFS
jgi:hypothetical protein